MLSATLWLVALVCNFLVSLLCLVIAMSLINLYHFAILYAIDH
ncbi:hypothetical protein [Moraxella lacunata]